MTNAPERIYLTDDGDSGYSEDEIYWSAKKVHPRDTEYVRADRASERDAYLTEALEAAETRADRLEASLRKLDEAAREVGRKGAVTGPQWTKLTIASLAARSVLALIDKETDA